MDEARSIAGFEGGRGGEIRGRGDRPVLPFGSLSSGQARTRLARVVRRAPEVMVKITGKNRDAQHLEAHLTYISRKGALTLEGADGGHLKGMSDVRERTDDWAAEESPSRRKDASMSASIMLSMPAGTSPAQVSMAL